MGEVLYDFWERDGQHSDIRKILQVGCSDNPLILILDLGDNTQDWAYPWRVPPQGGPLPSGDESET